jgi:hypothetical protein
MRVFGSKGVRSALDLGVKIFSKILGGGKDFSFPHF